MNSKLYEIVYTQTLINDFGPNLVKSSRAVVLDTIANGKRFIAMSCERLNIHPKSYGRKEINLLNVIFFYKPGLRFNEVFTIRRNADIISTIQELMSATSIRIEKEIDVDRDFINNYLDELYPPSKYDKENWKIGDLFYGDNVGIFRLLDSIRYDKSVKLLIDKINEKNI